MTPDLQKLVAFIRDAKARQTSDEFIASMLRQHGWPERRIFSAFDAYYEAALGAPIPSRGSRAEQARDAFYYLLLFIFLGCWTVALVLFADQYVDHVLPSALDTSYGASYFRTAIAGQLSTLIVSFPLFLFMASVIGREVARRPEAYESGVRKWLTYLALVITATTLLSDAVWFLTSFLTGDLSSRFALKALALFIVAAGVFSYYLGAVRSDGPSRLRDRTFSGAAIVVVAIALLLGFLSTGSPAHQRAISFDQLAVSRLSSIQDILYTKWSKGRLPQSLTVLALAPDAIVDPSTGREFDYFPGAGAHYRICAQFAQPSDEDQQNAGWTHPAGTFCFAKDASVSEPIYNAPLIR